MLNWITWNRTVLIFKLHTYVKLTVRNRIIFDIETVLTLNWIVWNRTVLTFNYV